MHERGLPASATSGVNWCCSTTSPPEPTMLAGPGFRHRHRDDVPESDRGGGRGARHGGGADEAQPATGTSSPSMAPHPVRGRHPGWRLTIGRHAALHSRFPAPTARPMPPYRATGGSASRGPESAGAQPAERGDRHDQVSWSLCTPVGSLPPPRRCGGQRRCGSSRAPPWSCPWPVWSAGAPAARDPRVGQPGLGRARSPSSRRPVPSGSRSPACAAPTPTHRSDRRRRRRPGWPAHPVRRAGTGNGPGATQAPRPCPTPPQRHAAIMSDQRSPLVSDPGPTSGTPQGKSVALGRAAVAFTLGAYNPASPPLTTRRAEQITGLFPCQPAGDPAP